MKIEQHGYLSPPAVALRRRDGVPPWGLHPCEVDHFADWQPGAWAALDEARALRDEIEAA